MRMRVVVTTPVLLATIFTFTSFTQERPPAASAIGLNHFYAVLDDETAEAVKNSKVMPEFANFRVQTVAPGGGRSWTGRYLIGRQTYVELFSLADLKESGDPAIRGLTAIALGVDRIGELAALETRARSLGAKPEARLEKYQIQDQEVDWQKTLAIPPDQPHVAQPFSVYAMEYSQTFFDAIGKEAAEGPADAISRERYNNDNYQNRLMRDVTGIEIGVPRADYQRQEPMLKAAGFRVTAARNSVSVDGPDINFVFVFVDQNSIGLRRIDFLLNQPVKQKRIETIGNSVLTIGPGNQARWVFTAR